ncbi:ketoacyl-synt-domain-containing protein [Aspergillus steynii IBT 23096]|uniref:Ketoacyl-synt-domain-containing protein n=1 Tax=Aspergillus steynii IBT 23096 TaxID=1392250 RepID=A0A2I2GSR9_9EURO|nr:ketoacyl-synt-domain-containing protein [Aspergillus steynii IBT 23096]PLB55929.1 ketoacyl-synt-domain-containing protein [Aspergillus steynii IBT 23096]
MVNAVDVLHFGDQTVDIRSSLQELVHLSKSSQTLATFLQSSADTLRAALFAPPSASLSESSWRSLRDLGDAFAESPDENAPLAPAALCICQLGYLLLHLQDKPRLLCGNDRKILLGVCTGMLSASAAACISSVSELLKLGPELIHIALRLGMRVSSRSQNVEHTPGSWSLACAGISLDPLRDTIAQFHQIHSIPPTKRVYVSALVHQSAFTVSGPPRILQEFSRFTETQLPEARRTRLSIHGAYHASHIHGADVESILGESPILDTAVVSRRSVFSTSSGRAMEDVSTLGECLRNALRDILRQPLDWRATLQGLVDCDLEHPVLTTIGPSYMAKSLKETLQWDKIADGKDTPPVQDGSISGSFAIVGMSGRFPGSDDLDSFWGVLEDGLDLHREIPANRFPVETHCDPTGKIPNTTTTPYGCFYDHPDLFDARLFNMSPREAAATDPNHRLLLLTTYEALQMAGYSPDRTPSTRRHRIGTFVGQTSDDWREANASQKIDAFWTTGGVRAFGPGRLNYHFGWEGPSYSIDAACSSSMAAIQIGLTALRSRECDMAVAGGANMISSSDPFAGLSRGSFLSPTGSCKTWDSEADGYCRGEGVGIVVIKRLEDAIADRDRIQAVIRSISTNHSAEAISITHPHAGTQQRLFKTVLDDAGVHPDQLNYVEMHGTGTQAGDGIETSAVANSLASRRADSHPLYIGSIKPNIGHGEAASGIASVIKSALMFQKNSIPPHIGIKGTINPRIPLKALHALNIKIPMERMPFTADPAGDGKRRILVNNFNAAGGNTSVLLEEGPLDQLVRHSPDPRGCHVVTVSAKTLDSLQGNTQRLLSYLQARPATDLGDLAYSTTARQMHCGYRKAHVVDHVDQLISSLQKDVATKTDPSLMAANKSPVAVFLFPGQGSLYSGLAYRLFLTSQVFARSIREIDEICQLLNLPSVLEPICDPVFDYTTCSSVQGQLVIVACGIALASLWASWGVSPQLVTGHSLGAYAAWYTAGVLSLHDTIYLVGQRALLIEKTCQRGSHAMLTTSLPAAALQQYLSAFPSCEIACLNGPKTTVVSGTADDITRLGIELKANGVQTSLIEVPFAFHSSQLDSCLDGLQTLGDNVEFHKPRVPILSTLLSDVVSDAGIINAEYITRQTRQPVDFVSAIEKYAATAGFNARSTFWIEMGARPLCIPMVKTILGSPAVNSLPSMSPREANWSTLSTSLAKAYCGGFNINWTAMHKEYEHSLRLLPLPSYAFDLKSHWLQYEGDWLITKSTQQGLVKPSPHAAKKALSSTLQKVDSENFSTSEATVSFVSNLADPELNAAISGHLVNGHRLCPSSVYADMAFTAAAYIWRRTSTLEAPAMDVSNMEVRNPLLYTGGDDHLVKVKASKVSGASFVTVQISSVRGKEEEAAHAHCEVHYGNGDAWMAQWAKHLYLIQGRIDSLERSLQQGTMRQIKRSDAYKAFATFVDYSPKFQGMDDVLLDPNCLEASAAVQFQTTPSDGTFTVSPYWIDSLAHLSGFILNTSETIPEDVVYISHGWGSMRFARPLSERGSYRTYVRMQETGEPGVMAGDVYVIEQQRIIAVVSDVKFRSIKQRFLNVLLPSTTLGASAPPTAAKITKNRPLGTISIPTAKTGPSFTEVVSIISEETGVAIAELTDQTDLADIGLDSLMSIMIVDRLRQELQVELPSSAFLCPQLGDLRQVFDERYQMPAGAYFTPPSSVETSTPAVSTPSSEDGGSFAEILRNIIASELGLAVYEVQPDIVFSELGIDSLLSLTIINAVYEQTGRRLPSSFFFGDYSNYAEVQRAFGGLCPSEPPTVAVTPVTPSPRCQSTLLQGSITSRSPALFLLPDGSGSAGSYAGLPVLGDSDRPVWGIHSPFLRCPEQFQHSLEEVAKMYVDEILRLDPNGPYILGGWSIGGVYAFEATRLLRQLGKTMDGLLLIDAPCPGTIPPLPTETVDLLDRLGITTSSKSQKDRSATREHFLASIEALKTYIPQPMIDENAPRCLALWAGSGVWESVSEEERVAMKARWGNDESDAQRWIMEARTWRGANGWDQLMRYVRVETVGGNHFSIMRRPQWVAFLRRT